MHISIVKLDNAKDLPLPQYATADSAGLDLIAAVYSNLEIKPLERVLVPTGISVAIPTDYEGQIRPRSGLAYKHGLTVLNAPGTIDSDYRGEIKVLLINYGQETFTVERGMRIAQLVIAPYQKISWRETSSLELQDGRDHGAGFGSTGIYAKRLA